MLRPGCAQGRGPTIGLRMGFRLLAPPFKYKNRHYGVCILDINKQNLFWIFFVPLGHSLALKVLKRTLEWFFEEL